MTRRVSRLGRFPVAPISPSGAPARPDGERGGPTRSRHWLLLCALLVIAVDFATKVWASSALREGRIDLAGPLDLELAHNSGVAFSLFAGAPPTAIVAATALVTALMATAAWLGLLPPIPGGLVVGGAVANLLDRLESGSVVDLLSLGWWPTFNLADVFISTGVGLLVLGILRLPRATPTIDRDTPI